jgi:hypothetical protein
LTPLGDEAVHEILDATGTALLARTREEQSDIDAATGGGRSVFFAYNAQAKSRRISMAQSSCPTRW